jgi:ribonucleoside-diphosphate reductase alpha chain
MPQDQFANSSSNTPLVDNTMTELDFAGLSQYRVIRRNGQLSSFDARKIATAMTQAFLAVEGDTATASNRIQNAVESLTKQVIKGISRHLHEEGKVPIEDIQDQVELALMRAGFHKVARAYVLYREEHAHLRVDKQQKTVIYVTDNAGHRRPLDEERLRALVTEACANLEDVNPERIVEESLRNLFDGILSRDVNHVLVMSTRTLIEKEPNYTYVAARLLLDQLRKEALGFVKFGSGTATAAEMARYYPDYFKAYVQCGINHELLNPTLAEFDLARLGNALVAERDLQFTFLGLQTLYDRYFLHWEDTRFELPQAFFMRVAMGLALNEEGREARAIEFYNLLSRFDFMSSTPTLFNSGTLRSQLSSCYLTTVPDDLEGIFNAIKDNAMLSKFAGGLGNDWTPVRGMGSHIKGTNGKSQGVVPFLKVANDTLVGVNQCFVPDTKIFTAKGIQKIKDIKVGDLVLGQRGQYREVKERLRYNQLDVMVEIEIEHAIEPLKVTAGHPFWAILNVPLAQNIQRTMAWLEQGKLKPAWVEAERLKPGDYVAQVIPTEIVPVSDFTEEDARLYGIMLAAGHCCQTQFEWGVSANPNTGTHLDFVRSYLTERGIHYWEVAQYQNNIQLRWSLSHGVAREATNGQLIAGGPVLPFSFDDLYDENRQKRIVRRFAHLPHKQTLAMIQGLIETNGRVSCGQEISFTNTSQPLIEGLRYQSLRLGIPVAGQYRERDCSHTGTRAHGEQSHLNGVVKVYELRIPAVPELARLVGCQPLTKYNWCKWHGCLFTRVKAQREIPSVPFLYDLKVQGDETYMTSAALVHNGGRRRGSGCAYLETWHIDIEEFLELRKNTGDERRRTHDMNTANWIPDLFLERVHENREWTLFSPNEVPDLHDLYGKAFKEIYEKYEMAAEQGLMKVWKRVSAVGLWRKLLTMLFETAHPWLCFKDPCNLRSPQQHAGVVHSSNLCCEITLNTKAGEEVAVCFPKGTSILTRQGQMPIESCDNQEVLIPFSESLRSQHKYLKAKLIPQGSKLVYELVTKNGIVIEATEEHPFLVQPRIVRNKPRVFHWKKLKELQVGDFIVCPFTAPVYEEPGIQDADFTAAGWMLGNGWMSSSYGTCFGPHETSAKDFVLPILNRWYNQSEPGSNASDDEAPSPFWKPNGVMNWQTERQSFIDYVAKRFDFHQMKSTEKYLGQAIKTAEPHQISSFLSGLFSAEGSVIIEPQTKGQVSICLFATSITLLRDVQLLLKAFGIHGYIRGGYVRRRGEERWQGQYEITTAESIANFAQFIGFSLSPAKHAKLVEAKNRFFAKYVFPNSAVVSISAKEEKEVFDLSLPEDHNFLANGLVVHNCNLGSVNLPAHIEDGKLETDKLQGTIRTAMRMLDNVIDINYYSVPQARTANLRHRPIGLGLMGFQDALYKLRIPYASQKAVEFADYAQEVISYYAISASSDLAEERGPYSSFEGSLWSQGILPIDSIQLLAEARGKYLEMSTTSTLDWDNLRDRVKTVGMRNSNTMAIAPTATISSVCGVSQSIEPMYQNLFVKSNLSGEFTIINPYLVRDLKALGFWDEVMVNDLKYYDGSIRSIERIPDEIKKLYATAFEIDPIWLVEAASRRQKWIDQAQSLNLYMLEPSGRKLDHLYKLAWLRGLKTTYYLRSMGATHVQKSTVINNPPVKAVTPQTCTVDESEDCEACQ